MPVEPNEVAPVPAPTELPELMPESAPVPLIDALHAPHAIGTTTPNAQTHAVLIRKVTLTLLVRSDAHLVEGQSLRNLPLRATADSGRPRESAPFGR